MDYKGRRFYQYFLHAGEKPAISTNNLKYYRINNRITTPRVRLIDEEGKHLGTVETNKALAMAQEKGLDLVEISPKVDPPVAKILDFGQFKYELSRKQKKEKTRQKVGKVKGMRLSFRVGKNALDFKKEQTKKFLEKEHKVRIKMKLKGREKAHKDLAEKIINQFIKDIEEATPIKIEQPVTRIGATLTAVITKA